MASYQVKPLSINWTAQLALGIQAMGPGVLMAAAAIGASHLVSSTRAGAEFGWQLAWVILGVNLLKYPFFAAGGTLHRSNGRKFTAWIS